MNDAELRGMIRESIARHLGGGSDAGMVRLTASAEASAVKKADTTYVPTNAGSASFARFALLRSGDDDGACLIEPAVRCNHCGYCLSMGH